MSIVIMAGVSPSLGSARSSLPFVVQALPSAILSPAPVPFAVSSLVA